MFSTEPKFTVKRTDKDKDYRIYDLDVYPFDATGELSIYLLNSDEEGGTIHLSKEEALALLDYLKQQLESTSK